MPYALDDAQRPLLLISAMAMHTKNLKADPRASLFVTDPEAEAAAGIIAHMNKDHASAMIEIARHEKGVAASEAKMTAVDRLGFHLRLKTPQRVRSVRIGFPAEVGNAAECRGALVAMVKRSRSCEP